jgi:hypothetical protein
MTEPSIIHQDQPHNAEPSLHALIEPSNFYTPLSLAFQRNHSAFISPDRLARWKLQVGLDSSSRSTLHIDDNNSAALVDLDGETLSGVGKRAESKAREEREQVVWSGGIDGLKEKGEEGKLRACLQCAGLRRDELSSVRKTEGAILALSSLSFDLCPRLDLLTRMSRVCSSQASNGVAQRSPTFSGKASPFDPSSSPSTSRRLHPISILLLFTSISSPTSVPASKRTGTAARSHTITSCMAIPLPSIPFVQ